MLWWPLAVSAVWYQEQQAIMGTEVSVELWHDEQAQMRVCAAQVFSDMRRIDALMSPFIAESELSKVNRLAFAEPVNITSELIELISTALHYSEITAGAFDITFSSVGYLYDYRQRQRPSDARIQALLPAVNYRHIKLDQQQRSIRFTHPDVRIDLGGIAKGHAVDKAIKLLRECGIEHAVVKAGGDAYFLGDKNGQAWMLGVKHPRQENKVAVRLPLQNVAVSTSGDYERFFIEGGERVHHILQPQTGKPVKDKWSVTIIADSATMSDALSTSVFVMNQAAGLALIAKLKNVDAIVIDANGDMHYSAGLAPPQRH